MQGKAVNFGMGSDPVHLGHMAGQRGRFEDQNLAHIVKGLAPAVRDRFEEAFKSSIRAEVRQIARRQDVHEGIVKGYLLKRIRTALTDQNEAHAFESELRREAAHLLHK